MFGPIFFLDRLEHGVGRGAAGKVRFRMIFYSQTLINLQQRLLLHVGGYGCDLVQALLVLAGWRDLGSVLD